MQDIITGDCKNKYKKHLPAIIISGLLAIFLKVSLNYKSGGTLYTGNFASNMGGLLIWWILIFIIINVMDAVFCQISQMNLPNLWISKLQNLSAGRLFLMNLLVIFLIWLPYLIITYPGSAWFDCSSSIKQIYGVTQLSNWNPIIQTFFIGGFIRLGDIIKDENFGLFLYNVFQMLFAAGIISYGLTCAFKSAKQSSTGFNWLLLFLVYSLLPVYPFYATSAGKDTNWSCCILLMMIILWQMQLDNEWVKRNHNRVIYIFAFLSICLLRNAGVYVAIICAVVAIIYSVEKYRKVIVISTGVCILGILIWSNFFLPAVGVSLNGISRDSWNIQFQQMARYVKTYPEEITKEDVDTVNKMLLFDELATKYNPDIVDTVTEVYYGDEISDDDLDDFMQLYWKWFKNHPGCYADAFVAKCIGYFTPVSYHSVKPFTIIGVSDVSTSVQSLVPEFKLYSVNDLSNYIQYVRWLQNTPVINLFTHCGTWTWIIFFSFFAAIKRNERIIPMILPSLVVIIGLTIVPTNNYFRYSLPLVFVAPFLVYMIYSSGGEEVDTE